LALAALSSSFHQATGGAATAVTVMDDESASNTAVLNALILFIVAQPTFSACRHSPSRPAAIRVN
jgi:hypothetical protein